MSDCIHMNTHHASKAYACKDPYGEEKVTCANCGELLYVKTFYADLSKPIETEYRNDLYEQLHTFHGRYRMLIEFLELRRIEVPEYYRKRAEVEK